MKRKFRKGGKCLYTFKIGKTDYSVRISYHSLKRIKERNIDKNQVIKNVLSMELRVLEEMKKTGIDLMIIDTKNKFTTVLRRDGNKIIIVTAINKATDIFIKPNIKTKVIIK